MRSLAAFVVRIWTMLAMAFFAEPAPTTPQSQVGPYPTGVASPGQNGLAQAPDQNVYTASGPITQKQGTVFLNGAGVLVMTLALPTAGPPSQGGDDGKRLLIQGATAHAHTVTTPANGINGNKHISTYANVGDSTELVAFNGVWEAVGTPTATLS